MATKKATSKNENKETAESATTSKSNSKNSKTTSKTTSKSSNKAKTTEKKTATKKAKKTDEKASATKKSSLSQSKTAKSEHAQSGAQPASEPEVSLVQLAENLISGSRKDRQNSAATIAEISKNTPADLVPYGSAIVDALKRPEARTRWECFDALTNLVEFDSKTCRRALDSAEESVFDETSGTVRLSAMRFLCKLGTASPRLATSSWPLIDEALQCYHGDPEYTDMLVAVNDFASSKLPKQVREELVERMQFDATTPKSGLVRRANSIIDAALGRTPAEKEEAGESASESKAGDNDKAGSTSNAKKASKKSASKSGTKKGSSAKTSERKSDAKSGAKKGSSAKTSVKKTSTAETDEKSSAKKSASSKKSASAKKTAGSSKATSTKSATKTAKSSTKKTTKLPAKKADKDD